jgi:hypothetical protein
VQAFAYANDVYNGVLKELHALSITELQKKIFHIIKTKTLPENTQLLSILFKKLLPVQISKTHKHTGSSLFFEVVVLNKVELTQHTVDTTQSGQDRDNCNLII